MNFIEKRTDLSKSKTKKTNITTKLNTWFEGTLNTWLLTHETQNSNDLLRFYIHLHSPTQKHTHTHTHTHTQTHTHFLYKNINIQYNTIN